MKIRVDSENENSMNIEISLVKNAPFNLDVEKMIALIIAFSKTAIGKIKESSSSFKFEKGLTENDILNIIAIRLFQDTLSEEDFTKLLNTLELAYRVQNNTIH